MCFRCVGVRGVTRADSGRFCPFVLATRACVTVYVRACAYVRVRACVNVYTAFISENRKCLAKYDQTWVM